MKNNRQSLILDIIAKEAIETQEQLLERLRQRGVAIMTPSPAISAKCLPSEDIFR